MGVVFISATEETTAPINGAVLWEGSSTPSGWTAVTALDGYLVKGAGSGETPSTVTSYGASTHTHSNTATLLSGGAHTNHTATIGAYAGSGDNLVVTSIYAGYNVSTDHGHNPGTPGAPSSSGAHTHSTIPTTGASSNYPPCRYLRWITPTSVEQDEVPIGGIVMWASATAPAGWKICTAANAPDTPDMGAYFVYGSSSTGTAGASTHTHTQGNTPNASTTHTHTVSSGATASGGNTSAVCGSSSSGTRSIRTHTHNSVTVTSNPNATHYHTMNSSGSESSLPPYLQLCFIKRIS